MKRLALLIGLSVVLLGFLYAYSNQPWLLLPEDLGVLQIAMYLAVFGSMVVMLVFNQTRIFFILLLFLGTAINVETFDYIRHTNEAFKEVSDSGYISDAYILLVFPIFITTFALLNERGFFTRIGMMRLVITLIVIGILDLFVFLPQYSPFGMGCSACGFVLLPNILPIEITSNIALIVAIVFLIIVTVKNTHIEGIYFLALLSAVLGALSDRTLDVFILFATSYALLSALFILSHSYVMAFIDELTGIKGRRAMNERLKTLVGNYTLVMCDIDHFKQFNDTHGHDVGDEVLKLVATILDGVKGKGKAYRWGGEEFILLFDNKTVKEAQPFVETVRKAIEARPIVLRTPKRTKGNTKKDTPTKKSDTKVLHITMSFGMAYAKNGTHIQEVFKQADNALYKAKEAGRNRVCT